MITNDRGFADYTVDEIYGVVLLQIPQRNVEVLLKSFRKPLRECQIYEGRLIAVTPDEWGSVSLPAEV